MKHSPKLPAFSGRCHVQLLPGTAAHTAQTARMLALFAPTPREVRALAALPAGITARSGNRALWLLLALLLAYAVGCTPARDAAQQRHRDEHAAPMASRYEAHWADTDGD
jgi:hypothetical protein